MTIVPAVPRGAPARGRVTARGDIAVVIVNYRTTDVLADCLAALRAATGLAPDLRVVIVDNASGGDTPQQLNALVAACRPALRAEWHGAERNGGFAFGNNVGLRRVLGDAAPARYVLLLNPDTRVAPDAVATLADFLDAHPAAGIAGARLEGPTGQAQASAHAVPSPLTEFLRAARLYSLAPLWPQFVTSTAPRQVAHRCDWVSGAAFMVRRKVFAQVGLLDEGFFLYFEEVDFCLRARRAGWEVWHVPEARIVHLEAAATGIRAADRPRPRYWFDARRRFFRKHYGLAGWLAADLLWLFGRLVRPVRKLLRPHQPLPHDPPRFARDLLLGDLAALLRTHRPDARNNPGRSTSRPTG